MGDLISQHWHLAWMIPAVFLIAYLGSPRHRGRMASRRVRQLLEQSLDPRGFTQFHDLVLPTGGGSEMLDHLLVSRYGLFVVVSEHRPGVLSGGESQETWTQKHLGRVRPWPNPIYRARLQMETLERLLDIPRSRIQLLVVIDGQDQVPEKLPRQVITTERLVDYLHSRTEQLLSPEQADRLVEVIGEKRLAPRHRPDTTAIVRWLLVLAVLAGVYYVYGDELSSLIDHYDERIERLARPERFTETGQRKSERQMQEENLICAISEDTMRCSCYGKEGDRVEIEFARCRELAERGSVLKQ